MRPGLCFAFTAWCLSGVSLISAEPASQDRWPQWRGPLGTGSAPDANPPTDWSETENVRWKVPLPGNGHSTPIVWDNHIFLTTAIPVGEALEPRHSRAPGAHDNDPVTHRQKWVVLAVDRRDGKVLWERTVASDLPFEGAHQTATLANHSPVTDGQFVYVSFGSYGIYCLDFTGQVIWEQDLGDMQIKHGHGESTSPVLYGDLLIINWDHDGKSFLAAFDKTTGRERWRVDRAEETSWATPIVYEHAGQPQLIVSGTNRVRGYELTTGNVIWECGGLSSNIVASPVAGDGMVFAGSSYETRNLLAIHLEGARGDITGTNQVAWSRSRGTPYVPSPLLLGDALYFLTHYQGILTRVSAQTGEERPGAMRLGGITDIYASPVGAADRVYVTARDGTTAVLSHTDIPRIMAVNRLDDRFSASAAIAGRDLLLRGEQYLYCLSEVNP